MKIRLAGSADHDAIWAILEPTIRAGETYALPRDMTRDAALAWWLASEVWVAVDDNGSIDLRTPSGSAARPTSVGLAIDLRTPSGSAARPTSVGLAIDLRTPSGSAARPTSVGLAIDLRTPSGSAARPTSVGLAIDLRTPSGSAARPTSVGLAIDLRTPSGSAARPTSVGLAILGTYLIHPNQLGSGSHVANCGYVTAPAATGKGVARAMCAHSLERAKALGFRAMQFNFVVSTNERAVRLWQMMGFAIVGTLPKACAHPRLGDVDVYVMFRAL